LQYLHLTRLQVRPEKLLSVSAATDHVMQLLLVKSRFAPGCCVGENAASASVKIVGHPGHSIFDPVAFWAVARLTLRDTSGNMKGRYWLEGAHALRQRLSAGDAIHAEVRLSQAA
jgi:hypothetical protein